MAQAPTIEEPVSAEQRRKVAEGLVAEARSRITVTNRTLLALFLLIIWSWLSNLSGIDFTEGKMGTLDARLQAITNATGELAGQCSCRLDQERAAKNTCRCGAGETIGPGGRCRAVVPTKQTAATPPPKGSGTSRMSPAAQGKPEGNQRQQDCRDRHTRLIAGLQSLNRDFDLFLIRLTDVHLKYHPLLLVMLIGLTLAYATWNRYKVRALIAEAVHIYRSEIGWNRQHTGVILYSVPFWLWPLSSKLSPTPTDDDLREFLSVNPRSKIRWVFVILFAVLLIFITLHTIWTQSVLSTEQLGVSPAEINENWKSSPLGAEERTLLGRHYANLSYTGSPVLDVLILFLIFTPAVVFLLASEMVKDFSRDNLKEALRERARLRSLSRRTVLVGGGLAVAFAFMMPGVQQWARSRGLPLFRQPRFRVDDSSAGPARAWTVFPEEREALVRLRANDPQGAMNALWGALGPAGGNQRLILHTHRRIYDLLAGLSVRYGTAADLGRVIERIEASVATEQPPPGLDRERWSRTRGWLQARLGLWRPPQSKWRRGWIDPRRTWHGVQLPPPRSTGTGRLLT